MPLLPVYPSDIRIFPPEISMNSNALFPKSFPIPIEGREDFFCIDPKSFSIKQLNEYKKEMLQLINIEKNHLKRMNNHSNACMKTYNQGIALAEETIKTKSIHSRNLSHSTFKSTQRSINYFNPKTLTSTQLQLYIKGITEEISYEKKRIDEYKNESTSRIEAYQHGIQNANEELSRRKEK